MATIDNLRIETPTPNGTSKRKWYLAFLIIIVIIATGGLVYNFSSSNSKEVKVYTIPNNIPGRVAGFAAGGYLEVIPPGPFVVSSLIPGRITSMNVVEGQAVEAGDIIAHIDDQIFRNEAKRQDAILTVLKAKLVRIKAGFRKEDIIQVKATLAKAKAQQKLTLSELERTKQLLKIGAVEQKKHDALESELLVLNADVTAKSAAVDLHEEGARKEDIAVVQAEVKEAEIVLRNIMWKIQSCIIKSPVSGIILERFVGPGNWVTPNSSRKQAASIVSIVDPHEIQAWVDVNQRDLGRVFKDQDVFLTTDAEPGHKIKGRVKYLMPQANLQKNTVQVKVAIEKTPVDLRPGMSVKVTFFSRENAMSQAAGVSAISIPVSAIVSRGGKSGVFTFANGISSFRAVKHGRRVGDFIEISEGVRPGDMIIINATTLSDKQAVHIKEK